MSGKWHWVYLDSSGNPSTVGPGNGAAYPTQGDAESFIGGAWPDLLAAGVDAVSLHEGERLVYGPMSLQPPSGSQPRS